MGNSLLQDFCQAVKFADGMGFAALCGVNIYASFADWCGVNVYVIFLLTGGKNDIIRLR